MKPEKLIEVLSVAERLKDAVRHSCLLYTSYNEGVHGSEKSRMGYSRTSG